MRLEVYTKHGVFHGKSVQYDEQKYNKMLDFVKEFNEIDGFHFEIDNGDILYMTKNMINDSIFILRKNNE